MSDKPLIVDGVKVDFTADDLDDIDLLEAFEEGRISEAMKGLMGEDGFTRLKEALRGEDGRCRATAVTEWFEKASAKLGANAKN